MRGGALAFGKLGFGGTVAVNLLYGDTHAYITGGSLVDAAGLGSITVPTYNDTITVLRQATNGESKSNRRVSTILPG